MSSFNKLFRLAKKTGDRMIVFDSHTGDGFAIVGIDEYEKLVSDPRDVSSLSGDELIEQINRDIGTWRSKKEAEEDMLDDEFFMERERQRQMPWERPILDPYPSYTDVSDDSWESAGDLLHDRYRMDDDDEDDIYDEHADDGIFGMDDEEDISFDDVLPHEAFWHPIPPREETFAETWEEEPLDEDPVFFEEPVE